MSQCSSCRKLFDKAPNQILYFKFFMSIRLPKLVSKSQKIGALRTHIPSAPFVKPNQLKSKNGHYAFLPAVTLSCDAIASPISEVVFVPPKSGV